MNPVLQEILETGEVTDGTRRYPLTFHMDESGGELLARTIERLRPTNTLEVGMAFGLSTLYICEALSRLPGPCRHIAIDPFQHSDWYGVGLSNVRRAGFDRFLEFHDEGSEYVLPRLARDRHLLDFALIDGLHRFDQALVEFYYIDRMLRVGGVVVFDDANSAAVNKVVRHVLTYGNYRVIPEHPVKRPTVAGRLRRKVTSLPGIRETVHPNVRIRDWDLGLAGRCAVLEKAESKERPNFWHEEF